MNLEDERVPDHPGDDSHIHSLDRCEHYVAGVEVGWLCGKSPMFTNVSTARASSDEHEVSLGEAMVRALFAIDDAECLHLSATGIDQAEGPEKVWECDACGFYYRQRVDEDGISHMVPAAVHVPDDPDGVVLR